MSSTRNRLIAIVSILTALFTTGAPAPPAYPRSGEVAMVASISDGDRMGPDQPAGKEGWDALGLIGEIAVMRRYTGGLDHWEVWVCDLPHGRAEIDAEMAADVLGTELTPYFLWLSGGRYRPVFVAAGTAEPTSGEAYPCATDIERRSPGRSNGAVVVTDELNTPPAYAYPDTAFAGSQGAVSVTFPDNGRVIRVGAHVVLPEAWNFNIKIAAHEIGHALGWPHSYQGEIEAGAQYNNPIDVMSADLHRSGALEGRPQGTLAVNRYAAGWIEPDQVTVHAGTLGHYRLGPVGSDGLQLVVLPTDRLGSFLALDARIDGDYDAGIEEEGVTIHRVDQDEASCPHPARGGCFGHKRRTQPVLTGNAVARDYAHVLTVGDSMPIGGLQITVLDRRQDHFEIRVSASAHDATRSPTTQASTGATQDNIAGPSIQIHTKRHRDLAEWAVARYQDAGLELPPLDIWIHEDGTPCKGNNGLYRKTSRHIEIQVCAPWPSRIQRALLHELGHAWADVTLGPQQRAAFLELRGLDHWHRGEWERQGFEHAAEILMWGLVEERFPLTSIANTDDPSLVRAFRMLTALDPISAPFQEAVVGSDTSTRVDTA